MRILSLNCWSGRVPGLVAYLAGMDADIYCLQEVLSSPPEVPEELTFTEQGSTPEPQRAKLFEELCGALPEHHAFHLPAARGYLHDNAMTEHESLYGIATFVRKRVPIIASHSAFVFGDFRAGGWDPPPLPRPMHAVRVWDYEHGRPLVVAHMHGLWIPNGKKDTLDRENQAMNFTKGIARIWRPDDPIVACGDFNVLPGSFTFKELGALGLYDLVTTRGHTDTRTSFYKKEVRFADYLFVPHGFAYQDFNVPPHPEVSDHRPLILDL